jgi:hypothetical protein
VNVQKAKYKDTLIKGVPPKKKNQNWKKFRLEKQKLICYNDIVLKASQP